MEISKIKSREQKHENIREELFRNITLILQLYGNSSIRI